MNIRIEGTKKELEAALKILSKLTGKEELVSRLYPNKGSKTYRIYLNKVVFKQDK